MLPPGPVASPAARVQYRASFILTSIYNAVLDAKWGGTPGPQSTPASAC
jgi:hypothetical protein